jgi:hypothetical protein
MPTLVVQLPIPGLVHLAYPRAADGVVHQCAWCQRVLDRAGRFRIPATQLLRDASHGCCSRCAPLLRPARGLG